MLRCAFVITVIGALGTGASAQDQRRSYEVAEQLGTLLASEKLCELTFDQAQIAAFVTANVSPADLDFASSLQGVVGYRMLGLEDMSATARVAHCTAVTQSARHLGFID